MELLEGESLAERLQRGPLSVAEALPIGLGMLAALAALHARGIVHRDLKPSNVFLTAARREAARLRPRAAAQRGRVAQHASPALTRTGHRGGHAALHGARAGDAATALDAAQRPVRGGRHPLRDARGPAGLRRPDRRRDPARDALRAAAGAHRLAGRGGRRIA